MKKLIIIAVASSFLFISCAKVDPTPDSQRNTTQVKPDPNAPLIPQKFVITNLETNSGIVEYRVIYTDVNLVVHNVALSMGQSITVCLSSNVITTNFAHTLVAAGAC